MANYIGAKTAGVIANVDGGTISNATLDSTVTFPAGIPVLLSSSSNTSAVTSVEFDNTVITSTYKHYVLRIHTIIPATDTVSPYVAFSTDNGSSFKNVGTGRLYNRVGATSSGAESNGETSSGMEFGLNLGNDAGIGQSAEISIFGSQDTNYNYFDVKSWLSGKHNTAHYAWWTSAYVYHNGSQINFLKLYFSSGNIAKHDVDLYGIK